MALSHWLESEPRAGLLSWASKTSLFMTQVNYCTKDRFNGWENIFSTQSSQITPFSLLRGVHWVKNIDFCMTQGEPKAFFSSSKFGQIRSNICGHAAEYLRFFSTRNICNPDSHPHMHKLCWINKSVLDLGCKNRIFPFTEVFKILSGHTGQ